MNTDSYSQKECQPQGSGRQKMMCALYNAFLKKVFFIRVLSLFLQQNVSWLVFRCHLHCCRVRFLLLVSSSVFSCRLLINTFNNWRCNTHQFLTHWIVKCKIPCECLYMRTHEFKLMHMWGLLGYPSFVMFRFTNVRQVWNRNVIQGLEVQISSKYKVLFTVAGNKSSCNINCFLIDLHETSERNSVRLCWIMFSIISSTRFLHFCTASISIFWQQSSKRSAIMLNLRNMYFPNKSRYFQINHTFMNPEKCCNSYINVYLPTSVPIPPRMGQPLGNVRQQFAYLSGYVLPRTQTRPTGQKISSGCRTYNCEVT